MISINPPSPSKARVATLRPNCAGVFQNFENNLAPQRNLPRDVRRRCQITSLPTYPERHAGDPRGGPNLDRRKKDSETYEKIVGLDIERERAIFSRLRIDLPGKHDVTL
jgi:hypothetical protein